MSTEALLIQLDPPEAVVGDLAVAWREASDEATEAYRAWHDACPQRRTEAYYVYLAAADREGAAAETLRRQANALRCIRILSGAVL